jgi:hypothetical protein
MQSLKMSLTLGIMTGRYFFTMEVNVLTWFAERTTSPILCLTKSFTSSGDWILVFS